ncbi:DUF2793 domain-containing protein [Fertoebacter nigrum]|uniref:DUF2793 domain-containing protein n=1 Tax=Fertoeibacter niger TaxID=2656921 RepID=A0A8X8H382_9RHOB|nr:DUF2793 domain-containing protein [Fertoeibacter niger]NUB46511.1 DUF2793 domain-containing protein [Fertoeibacter niger]
MPDVSPILALPYILPAQAQKHVTHNEALRLLDLLVQPVVADRSLTTPPPDPAPGARHIVAAGGLGAWAGQDGTIAQWQGSGWAFVVPQAGWQVHVLAEQADVVFHAGVWQAAAERPLTVQRLGVSASPDATNRLAVSAAASLFSHAGAGHQMKINKTAAADTASLLFQSGWSGRAEMGLAGSDDFTVKVSPDGSLFLEALRAEAATGRVIAAHGMQVQGAISGTAVTQGPTDSTAGRLLKAGDFGLGGAQAPVLTDLTQAIAPGLYSFAENSATGSPGTGSFDCALLVCGAGVAGAGEAFVALRRSASVTSQRLWIGARMAATGAIAWTELRHAGNLLGAVSQSGGLPTGAVIERGSNANGSYVRFADGTQICRHAPTVTNIDVLSGGIYMSDTLGWTFPAVFSGAPVVSGTASVDRGWVARGASAASSTSATLRACRSVSATAVITLHVMAVGQWF